MKKRPPAAGNGRPKGALNKTTVAMKDAVLGVYADLQDGAGGDHAHFRTWAENNPTDFYKIASKLLPLDVHGTHDIAVAAVDPAELRREAREYIDELFGEGSSDGAIGPLIEHK